MAVQSTLTAAAPRHDNRGMDEQSSKQGGTAPVVLAVSLVLVALPLFYVLSVGPVLLLDSLGYFNDRTREVLQGIYGPLAWTIENVPVAGPVIEGYAEWWD